MRYFSATDLVETLYRGLADNSVGRVIEQIMKADLILIDEIGFAPMDDTGAQLFFRIVAAAYETPVSRHRLALALRGLGEVPPRAHHRRQSARPPLHHSVVVVTSGESFRLKEARQREGGHKLI